MDDHARLLRDLGPEVLSEWQQLAAEGQYPHLARYADGHPTSFQDALVIDLDLVEGYLVRDYSRVTLATKSLWYDPVTDHVPTAEILAYLDDRLELYRMILERHFRGEDLTLMETRLEGVAIMYRSTVLAVDLLRDQDEPPASPPP